MWLTEHWTAFSIVLGLISSAYRDLHHWRSNQQPQYAEDETLPLDHRFISHISGAKLTSHGDNARPLNLMCLEGAYTLQRTQPLSSHDNSNITLIPPFKYIYKYIYIYIYIYIYFSIFINNKCLISSIERIYIYIYIYIYKVGWRRHKINGAR